MITSQYKKFQIHYVDFTWRKKTSFTLVKIFNYVIEAKDFEFTIHLIKKLIEHPDIEFILRFFEELELL